MTPPTRILVVGGVIARDGKILAARRGPGRAMAGYWEFPGGKIDPGERPEDALGRELFEELTLKVSVGEAITTTAYDYDFGTVVLSTYWCTIVAGEPTMTEHSDLRWVERDSLASLTWAPADIPAVEAIVHGADS